MIYFKKIVDIIIKLMIPLIILSLLMGIAKIFLELKGVFQSPKISTGFNILVTNILSMFVVIELLRGIIAYFEINRMRLTLIADAALIFILREIMIGIYQQSIKPLKIISFSFLLLVIGAIRTLAILYSPGKMMRVMKNEKSIIKNRGHNNSHSSFNWHFTHYFSLEVIIKKNLILFYKFYYSRRKIINGISFIYLYMQVNGCVFYFHYAILLDDKDLETGSLKQSSNIRPNRILIVDSHTVLCIVV